jgi:hypothetical protein
MRVESGLSGLYRRKTEFGSEEKDEEEASYLLFIILACQFCPSYQ